MTRSPARIREQLSQLESQTLVLHQQWAGVYLRYAQRLAQVLERQAVYAVYQICTQIYPQSFLQLAYNPRQRFQEKVRLAIAQFQPQLFQQFQQQGIFLAPPEQSGSVNPPLPGPEGELSMAPVDLGDSPHRAIAQTDPELEAQGTEPGEARANLPDLDEIKTFLSQALQKEGLSLEMLVPGSLHHQADQSKLAVKTPEDLARWQETVEKVMGRSVVRLSMDLNRSLTKAQIIPPNLPPRILEMALQSDDNRLAPNREKMPHVVNLLIEKAPKPDDQSGDRPAEDSNEELEELTEAGDKEEQEEPARRGEISRLTAINLRLLDLEFSDLDLGLIRKELHGQLGQLKKLQQQYRQLERQKTIAEAELAWRSSWVNNQEEI